MDFKTLEMPKYRIMVGFFVILVGLLVGSVISIINKDLDNKALEVRCSLQEQALKHPTTTNKQTKSGSGSVRYVNLTDAEKQEICSKYDCKVEYLNDVIKGLMQKTWNYNNATESTSKPEIPIIPKDEMRKWAVGVSICRFDGSNHLGMALSLNLPLNLQITANAGSQWVSGSLMYRF